MAKKILPLAAVQSVAKRVLEELSGAITPDSTERSLADWSVRRLAQYGVTETWYHDCPALVLLGSRSRLSVSGKDYTPSDEPVGEVNLVTVDLSPRCGGILGDCARSFYVEGDQATAEPVAPEFRRGAALLRHLHDEVHRFLTPDRRFCDLYEFANGLIAEAGFENLDFLGNVGHSVTPSLADRDFVDRDNQLALGAAADFTLGAGPAITFEPISARRAGRGDSSTKRFISSTNTAPLGCCSERVGSRQ